MESTTENNQVVIILNSIEILKTGPQILQANQIRKDKAISYGTKLLEEIDAEGMSVERDEKAMNYLVKVNTANKEMKDSRAGVTQIMDQLKKMYTEVENELDIKKVGTVASKVQAHRDTFAKQVAAEKEAKRKAAQLVADKAKEAIEIKGDFEQRLTNHYQDFLTGRKQAMQTSFNAITYSEFGEKAAKLKAISPVINMAKLVEYFPFEARATFHSREECVAIQKDVFDNKREDITNNYAAEMGLLIDDLIEKLPSKLKELTDQKELADKAAAEQERQRKEKEKSDAAIANANAAKREELKKQAEEAEAENQRRNEAFQKQQDEAAAEQKRREEADNARIAAENEEAKRKENAEIEIKLQGEKTMVMFEQEATVAEMGTIATARQGYSIIVLHPVGYTQIFALWFEHEGKNLPTDKIGNTKLDQMKAWCEKKALKDGTKIESKFLEYQDSFKAVNKKSNTL